MSNPNNRFPYLNEQQYIQFQYPKNERQELIARGANFSPGVLISAYSQGVFPWISSDDEPIDWYSLNPRMVLYPQNLHISNSLTKTAKKKPFQFKVDTQFKAIIELCAQVSRHDQKGTWITANVKAAYTKMHELGYAHSVECYSANNELVGGFYGLCLGKVFFGESMVSLVPNASKLAFIHFVEFFKTQGLYLIDCQQSSAHMARFGAIELTRQEFLSELDSQLHSLDFEVWRGSWQNLFPDF